MELQAAKCEKAHNATQFVGTKSVDPTYNTNKSPVDT